MVTSWRGGPLVARHVGERRLRAQLRAVGYPVGELLQFWHSGIRSEEVVAASLRAVERCSGVGHCVRP